VSWFSTVLLFYAKVSTMSSYGVVATVAHTLKGGRQSDLTKFEIEYDAYNGSQMSTEAEMRQGGYNWHLSGTVSMLLYCIAFASWGR